MRVLMISPYAPERDGIAAYAVQQVAELRRQGHDVEVLSPTPTAAHHHLPLPSSRSMVELVRRAGRYDRIVVQFHPDFFFTPGWDPLRVLVTWLAFWLIAARTDLEILLHEIDYDWAPRPARARTVALRQARILVHTEAERRRCIEALGLVPGRVEVIDHGVAFTPKTRLGRTEARAELGLPADATIFVSIGFIQPHKGFDRAVRAFAHLPDDVDARLYVVGDIRVDERQWLEYADELTELIELTPGAELRRGFVSDEHFDLWIAAADRVVLPYRLIWSSSVVERAGLLGTPTIVTDVGGLAQQVGEGDVVIHDDDELLDAMLDAIGQPDAPRPSAHADAPLDREQLQAMIHAVRAPVDPTETTADGTIPRTETGGRRLLRSRRLGSTPRPRATSANPVNSVLKKFTDRAISWRVDAVAGHLDTTIRSVTQDIESLDERLAALEADRHPS